MTYEPTFAVESETILFNREAYKELFDELEISERPDDFPLGACPSCRTLYLALALAETFDGRFIQSTASATSTSTESCTSTLTSSCGTSTRWASSHRRPPRSPTCPSTTT